MPRVDNDLTKGLATPFLILAHVRTGGTFCAHALSNHSQIYCDRGETLHHLSAWRKAGVRPKAIMQTIWGQDGYLAAGFRVIYRQAFHEHIWPYILERKPRIIHLTRKNVTRQGVSYGYQQLVRNGELPFHPVHSFETKTITPVWAYPKAIVEYAVKVRREVKNARDWLKDYPGEVLEISYENMTGNCNSAYMSDFVADALCRFLGVRYMDLCVDLRRDFDVPMQSWFINWKEIKAGLEKAGFSGLEG